MVNFNFYNPARIIFGKDTEKVLPAQIQKFGSKVLLHYGGGSIKKIGLYDKIVKILKDAPLYKSAPHMPWWPPSLGCAPTGSDIWNKGP